MKKKIKITVQQRETEGKSRTTEDCFDAFITSRITKNLAQRSLVYYKEQVGYFLDFCYKDRIADYSIENIDSFILYCKEKRLKDSTINIRLRAVKVFFKFCYEREFIKKELKIELLKEDKLIKDCYSEEEIKKLLTVGENEDFHEYRNRIIINFLLCTGVRVSSLVNIRIEDINIKNKTLKLTHNKNREESTLPLAKQICELLEPYIAVLPSNCIYLFPSQWGEQFTVIGVQQAVRRFNKARGIELTSVHAFRRTFATNYAKRTHDVFRLQQLLCHSTLDMSRKYVKFTEEDLREGFDDICILNKIAR